MSQASARMLLVLLLFGILLLLLIRHQGWFQSLELVVYDHLLQQQTALPPDPRLLIVGIDEADIQAQNRFPLSDQVLADTLAILNASKPAVIGLDIYRDIPHEPGHAALSQQLQQETVIGIRNMGSEANRPVPAPAVLPSKRVAFNDLVLDPDLVLRRYMLYMPDNGTDSPQAIYSFATLVALKYLYTQHRITLRDGNTAPAPSVCLGAACFSPLQTNSGGYQYIDASAFQQLLSYRRRGAPAPQVSLSQLLAGQVSPELIRDKIVLIGTTAESAKDIFLTPYSASEPDFPYMAGVLIHGHIISQLLTAALADAHAPPELATQYHPVFHYWSETSELVWLLLWLCLGVALGWGGMHLITQALLFGLGILIQFAVTVWLFQQLIWIPIATPLLGYTLMSAVSFGYLLLYRSTHDSLTNLPNQVKLQRYLRWLHSQPMRLTWHPQQTTPQDVLILFDIDGLKIINTVFSTHMGDKLLLQFTERLQVLPKQFALSNSLIAKVGDDEFALLFSSAMLNIDLKAMARQLQQQLSAPFLLQQEEIFISVSVGLAIRERSNNLDLLHNAHAALYYAKMQMGRGRIEMFEGGMQAGTVVAFELERDLRHTLQEHQRYQLDPNYELKSQFLVYYQPLVYLPTGRIGGFEALVRWQHDQRGLVSPMEFIPITEETGLIVPIGEYVLQIACRQMWQWCQQFPDFNPFVMSVNLSGVQFALPDLVPRVQRILQTTGLPSKYLKLEVTESAAMTDMNTTIQRLNELKALDIHLSIDDFGTGYSSLSYLTQFPTDTLKVDRSFVTAMRNSERDMQIIRTIVSLAHHLDMQIIAEGVETAIQLQQLRNLGCEYGQGYLFAKPLPTDEAEALLVEDRRW